MRKKGVIALAMIFAVMLFFVSASGGNENAVIARYDFSSPRASFESLKKATRDKDIEGIFIHQWQCYKRAEGSAYYGMSFEDMIQEMKKRWPGEDIAMGMDQMWIDGYVKLADVVFVRESGRSHTQAGSSGTTACTIMLKHAPSGKQDTAMALNYDGTNEWWVSLTYAGE